jgi:hypothetical protein
VELDVRDHGRRPADGVLAGVRGPAHQLQVHLTCEAWGVGVRLDAEVRREQVAERVREVMASEEMRRKAARWKAEAAAAAGPGGSSYENLLAMVRSLSSSSDSSQA